MDSICRGSFSSTGAASYASCMIASDLMAVSSDLPETQQPSELILEPSMAEQPQDWPQLEQFTPSSSQKLLSSSILDVLMSHVTERFVSLLTGELQNKSTTWLQVGVALFQDWSSAQCLH